VRIRQEGWREVKVSVLSQVERVPTAKGKKRLDEGAKVRLKEHSRVALMTDASTFPAYQFAEGLRRGVDQAPWLSSVNDGAPWIARITQSSFPHVHLVLDWYHASSHLHTVADETWPAKDDAQRRAWLRTQHEHMEEGNTQTTFQSVTDLTTQAPTTALSNGFLSLLCAYHSNYFDTLWAQAAPPSRAH
jgi:hypothetical protein